MQTHLKQKGPIQTWKSEHLQHRSFPKPLDLSIHFPGKHQPKHLEITQE